MAEGGRHFRASGQPARSTGQAGSTRQAQSHSVQPVQPARGNVPGARPTPRPVKPARPVGPAPSETAQFIAAAASQSSRAAQPKLRQSTSGQRFSTSGRSSAASASTGSIPPRTPYGNGRSDRVAGAPNNPPRRRKRDILPVLLIVVGVALLLVAGGLFIRAQLGYKAARDTYDGIAETAVTENAGDGVPRIDFDALTAEGKDIVGWIYVPGTAINYPVVQSSDNSYYLRRLPNGEWNENGTIFMDMDDTAPGAVDQQTTLYGHHMNDGSMFQSIDGTMQQDAFDAITKVYYITRDTTYLFKPLFTAQVQDDYGDARVPTFESDEAFTAYLKDALSQARAKAPDAEERIAETKQVLTLVTCAGEIIPRTTRATMVCSLEEATAHQQ